MCSKQSKKAKYAKHLEERNKKIETLNMIFSKQTEHLEYVNSAKDKLFTIISHDLKDSLFSIKGFIDLLVDGTVSQKEFNELLPKLSENANNASLLLHNLLNWSKSQLQLLKSNPTSFNIQKVIECKLKFLEQKINCKDIKLVNKISKDYVYADKSMVEIIIQNLLSNAIKFSQKGASITLKNISHTGCTTLSISDTGVGISEENLTKIFNNKSFTTRGTADEVGAGLGLTICKELVELNKGKIWVESVKNVGSKFYVELPCIKPMA